MFSLILVIAGIAIAIALIAATLYSGGTHTLTEGRSNAQAAQAINELNQVQQAMTSYQIDKGEMPNHITELAPTYMRAVPVGWGASVPSLTAYESKPLPGDEETQLKVCKQVNAKLGMNGDPPKCTDIAPNFTGCCLSE